MENTGSGGKTRCLRAKRKTQGQGHGVQGTGSQGVENAGSGGN